MPVKGLHLLVRYPRCGFGIELHKMRRDQMCSEVVLAVIHLIQKHDTIARLALANVKLFAAGLSCQRGLRIGVHGLHEVLMLRWMNFEKNSDDVHGFTPSMPKSAATSLLTTEHT